MTLTQEDEALVDSLTYDDGLFHGLEACRVINSMHALNDAGLRITHERMVESSGMTVGAVKALMGLLEERGLARFAS